MKKHFILKANTNDEGFDERAVAMLVTIDNEIKKTALKLTTKVNELGVYQISIFDSSPIGITSADVDDDSDLEDLIDNLESGVEDAIELTTEQFKKISKKVGSGSVYIETMTMQIDKDSIMWEGYYKHTNLLVQSGHIKLSQILK